MLISSTSATWEGDPTTSLNIPPRMKEALTSATVTRGMAPGGAQEVTKFMARALALNPDDRHADPRAFAAALAYVRKIVGAPAPVRPDPAPAQATSRPVAPPAPDPTTVLRIPGLSDLFKHRPAPPATPAVQATPVPTPTPPAVQPAPAPTPTPAPARPVPDRTELHLRPEVERPDDATQALPRLTTNARPSRPGTMSVDGESTQALPANVRRPAVVPDPAERTEPDMRRLLHDVPRDGPGVAKKPAPFDEELTVIGSPLRVPPSVPESTLLLSPTGEHRFGPAPGETPRRSSAHVQWILIAINVFVAIALIVIAWVTL